MIRNDGNPPEMRDLAPHMDRTDRHRYAKCGKTGCDAQTRNEYCRRHRATCHAYNCTHRPLDRYCGEHEDVGKLVSYAASLGVGLYYAPGGNRVHLPGCEYLGEDKDRWRGREQGPAQRSVREEACKQCLVYAAKQEAALFGGTY